ncbi:hypothetical protein ARTHRO9AX_220109 [Arthrobacter sp. 9AX]|nr:hypothetical protein ARTHRO9AX_220109 [Arthrobacter sp. 9AX]
MLVGSGALGAEATTEDPFLRRLSLSSMNTVKPIQATAVPSTRINAGIVSMTECKPRSDCACPLFLRGFCSLAATSDDRPRSGQKQRIEGFSKAVAGSYLPLPALEAGAGCRS